MPPSAKSVTKFAFAEYLLDAASRSLTRDGEGVALAPKSLDCLIYLIQHHERAVGRDELISAVWGRTDVTYAVLGQTLWKLRRALNEAVETESLFIRTVPRFGYQWIAPLAMAPAVPDGPRAEISLPDSVPTRTETPPAKRSWRRWVGVGLGLVSMGAIFFALSIPWRSDRLSNLLSQVAPIDAAPRGKRLLVLPVEVESTNPEDAWMRLGIMDYVATRLRRIDRLQLIGSDRVLSLLGEQSAFDAHDARHIDQLLLVSGATDIVVPRAVHTDAGWRVVLTVQGHDGTRTSEGIAGRPLDATNDATHRLLQSLDLDDAWQVASSNTATELIQRMDAASLAGNYAEALALSRKAAADEQSDPNVQLKIAQLQFRSGSAEVAAHRFEELSKSPSLPLTVRISAELGLANIAEGQQRYAEAERRYTDAIELLGDKGDPPLRGQAFSMRGLVNTYLGRNEEGFADFARGRVAFAQSGDEVGLAGLDAKIGLAERARGRHQDAADAFDRATAVFDRFGMRDRAANALIGAIGERLALLQIPRAVALSDRADSLAKEVESPILRTYLTLVRGLSLLADGRLDALQALLDRLGPAVDPSNPAAIPDLLLLRVSLSMEPGRPAMSEREIEAAWERIEHPAEAAYGTSPSAAALILIDCALRTQNPALARRLLDHLEGASGEGDRLRPLALMLVRAQVLASNGDPAAETSFRAALAEADRTAYPDAIVTVGAAWARYLGPFSEHDTIVMVAGRLQPFVGVDFRAARAAAALYAALGEKRLESEARSMAVSLAHDRDPQGPL